MIPRPILHELMGWLGLARAGVARGLAGRARCGDVLCRMVGGA